MELTAYRVRQDLAGWKNSFRNLYKNMVTMDLQAWMDANPSHFGTYTDANLLQAALNNTTNPPSNLSGLFDFIKS